MNLSEASSNASLADQYYEKYGVRSISFISWRRILDTPKLALSFLSSSSIYFCLCGPFNCISIHKYSQQLSIFWLCSSGLISALLVLSTKYLFMNVSFSPDIILCGWLGLQHQLTNCFKTEWRQVVGWKLIEGWYQRMSSSFVGAAPIDLLLSCSSRMESWHLIALIDVRLGVN